MLTDLNFDEHRYVSLHIIVGSFKFKPIANSLREVARGFDVFHHVRGFPATRHCPDP